MAFERWQPVAILGNPVGMKLSSFYGKIYRPDSDNDGYYLVALDSPAVSIRTGEQHLLIHEHEDNLAAVDPTPEEWEAWREDEEAGSR